MASSTPKRYNVRLTPDLEKYTFVGKVEIELCAPLPDGRYKLHSVGHDIAFASVNGVPAKVTRLSSDLIGLHAHPPPADGAADHSFINGTAAAAASTVIELSFSGTFSQDTAQGGYIVHTPEGGDVLATHFEPGHCRKVFPCFDEPHLKATFQLTLIGLPEDLTAVSNTPISSVSTVAEPDDTAAPPGRLKTVAFEPTVRMSTYVFGFWVGSFGSIRAATRVRRCAPLDHDPGGPRNEGDQERPASATGGSDGDGVGEATVSMTAYVAAPRDPSSASFSLAFATRAFEFFAALFEVPFPLPKLDLVAVTKLHGLGMENFGAVTFLEDHMLVTSSTPFARRRRILRLLCHEICHQWFGNLVTPESFDELWLKEGLARFLEFVAVDLLDSPDPADTGAAIAAMVLEPAVGSGLISYGGGGRGMHYRIFTNFLSEVYFPALLADAQPSSHPVSQRHNGDLAAIMRSFDCLTYGKGACCVRQLEGHLGSRAFFSGVRRFIRRHQFACASPADLWGALQEACDELGVQARVAELMQPWLEESRCPMLSVALEAVQNPLGGEAGTLLVLKQRPFLLDESTPAPTKVVAGARSTAGGATDATEAKGATEVAAPTPRPTDAGAAAGSGAASGEARKTWGIPLRLRVGRIGVPGCIAIRTCIMADARLEIDFAALLVEADAAAAAATAATEAEGAMTPEEARSSEARGGTEYLVVNHGHMGFFMTRYEGRAAWDAALAAVASQACSEVEATGVIVDLCLALHQALHNSAAWPEEGLALVSRLADAAEVARLLDSCHTGWWLGQRLLWHIRLLSATRTAADCKKLVDGRTGGAAVAKEDNGVTTVTAGTAGDNHEDTKGGSAGEAGAQLGDSAVKALTAAMRDAQEVAQEVSEHLQYHTQAAAAGDGRSDELGTLLRGEAAHVQRIMDTIRELLP